MVRRRDSRQIGRTGGRSAGIEKEIEMIRMTLAAALAALALAGTAQALERGDTLGTTADSVRQALAEQGFDVRKVENDDGKLEAYALKDGKRLEIYVDPKTGAVTRIKEDD